MSGHKMHHSRHAHHLSSKQCDHEGWTEGIVSLTDQHTATELLDDGAAGRHKVGGLWAVGLARCRLAACGVGVGQFFEEHTLTAV